MPVHREIRTMFPEVLRDGTSDQDALKPPRRPAETRSPPPGSRRKCGISVKPDQTVLLLERDRAVSLSDTRGTTFTSNKLVNSLVGEEGGWWDGGEGTWTNGGTGGHFDQLSRLPP